MRRAPYNLQQARRALGFTLIEMLASLTLLALLASVAFPLSHLVQQRSREADLRQALMAIRGALDEYKRASDEGRVEKSVDASGYPPNLQSLTAGIVDKKDPNGKKIYFLRRLPADPMCDCSDKLAGETWETRSYASDPDNFSGGKDVFDVRSTSDKEGLNGIPYQSW